MLFIPTFRFNLISVSVLTSTMPLTVRFVDDYCVIQDKSSSRMIGRANLSHGLYLLHIEHTVSVCKTVLNKDCNSLSSASVDI